MHRLIVRMEARGAGLLATCFLAGAALCALVGQDVFLHPARAIVGYSPSSDFQIMTWSLEWWPWAIRHGADPLHTSLLWGPHGFSTLWMTTIPVPALLGLPLTLTVGPLAAYNVLMFAAVVLAAGAAYLLCHELTGKVAASTLGGLLFGLSPYMLGHTLSQHLDLTMVFPLPLMVLLGIRFTRRKTSARRFVAGFALLLLVVLGSSFELFVDLALVVAVVGLAAIAIARAQRKALLRVGRLLACAYAFCVPVLVPIAVLGLSAVHAPVGSAPANYAVDLLNVVVPTPTLLAGRFHWARAITQHFVGNIGERDGYLGLPLFAVILLGLRVEWRRGAWLAGVLVGVALLLSLGATLDVGGRSLGGLPFAIGRLPVLGDTLLPARMSVFVALGASCLCALWFARPRPAALQLAAGALVVASMLPNFSPTHRLARAWALTTKFAWSTAHAPADVVRNLVVGRGSNVLVLPTGDRTAASYWQVRSGMRFTLAVPATPFAPPAVAADPTVARLVGNVLPQLDGNALGAARLRSFLLANRVTTVVVTCAGVRRWARLVRKATTGRSVIVNGALVFRVPSMLKPLSADGEHVAARPALDAPQTLLAWLHYDGTRAHLRVQLGGSRIVTLSSPLADAEAPSASVGRAGRAAGTFTEWRGHELLLRVATHTRAGWRIVTLDQSTQPIWSQRTAIEPSGTVLAGWIDEAGASRNLRTAILSPGGRWQNPVTLDSGQGLSSVALGTSGAGVGIAAWHDSLASEARVQASLYTNGSWRPTVTLASTLDWLDTVAVVQHGRAVRWRFWNGRRGTFFRAALHGLAWGRPQLARHQNRQINGRTFTSSR